jgi:hypothetical protein
MSYNTELKQNNTNLQNILSTINRLPKANHNGIKWRLLNQELLFDYVCNANGIWVAGGAGGKGLYYSTDGKNWEQSNVTYFYVESICNANGIWVAGGSAGNGLYYSTDGKTWEQCNIISTTSDLSFSLVHYGNGIWIAACDWNDKEFYYSTDGKTWEKGNLTLYGYRVSIYYANGIWVLSDYDGNADSNQGLYYSTDGKIWTQSIATNKNYEVYYANGLWISGNYYSTDGKSWIETTNGKKTVYYGNGIWVGKLNNILYYSTDGKTWTQNVDAIDVIKGTIGEIEYCHGIWVLCSGKNIFGEPGGLYYSFDGKNWKASNITKGEFAMACNANGMWIACSEDDGIYYSI